MTRLKAVMLLLIANDAPLGPERRDHALKGSLAQARECHVGGDFLLISRIDDTVGPGGSVYFVRVGTHAELFTRPLLVRLRLRPTSSHLGFAVKARPFAPK